MEKWDCPDIMRTSGNPGQGSIKAIAVAVTPKVLLCGSVLLSLCGELLVSVLSPPLWHWFLISHWKLFPTTPLGKAGMEERLGGLPSTYLV